MYLPSGNDSSILPNIPEGNPSAIPRGIPDSGSEGYLHNMIEVGVADAISGGDMRLLRYPRVGGESGKVSRRKRQSAFSVLNFLLVVFNIILDINNNGK